MGIDEPSRIDRRPVAGSLPELAAHLAQIAPGRLLIIAGDEVHFSDAAPEVASLAEMLGAPVYCSSWPSHIPFPTNHPLWSGKMPHNGTEIASLLSNYDALFALGGKSLITILYTEGSAGAAGLRRVPDDRRCPRSRPHLYDRIVGGGRYSRFPARLEPDDQDCDRPHLWRPGRNWCARRANANAKIARRWKTALPKNGRRPPSRPWWRRMK